MTQSVDTRGVNSDRVDQDLRRWPTVLATLIAGLIVGALVGGIYAAARPTTFTSSTALSVLPDPTVDITSQNGSDSNVPTQDATSFIQSQLVVINGPQLADQVRRQAGLRSDPTVTATQVGQTYVVQISATADTRAQATRVAQLTGSGYAGIRTRQLSSEISGLLSSTNQQLRAVSSSLGSARTTTTSTLTPSQTALQTEYERLLSVRSSLAATNSQVARVVTVVSPARAAGSGISTAVKDALAGAVIGAILALLALVAERRTMPRIRSVGDLVALDVLVMLPVQARRTIRSMRRAMFAGSADVRLLAARLHAGPSGQPKPLVVIGATPGVGASLIATSVAASLASRGPVLLVREVPAPSGAAAPIDHPHPDDVAPADAAEPHDDLGSLWDLASIDDADRGVPSPTPAPAAEAELQSNGARHARPAARPSTVPGVWLLDVTASSGPYDPAPRLPELVAPAHRAGWLVVVDAEPVSSSDMASACARDGAALALVAGRGRTSPAEVLAAVELFDADHCTVLGVVLNDVPGPLRRAAGRRLFRTVEVQDGADATDLANAPAHRAARSSVEGPDHPDPALDDGRHARSSMLSSKR